MVSLWETLRSQGQPEVPRVSRALARFVADFGAGAGFDGVVGSDLGATVASARSFVRAAGRVLAGRQGARPE
jgi:hypothetical protein